MFKITLSPLASLTDDTPPTVLNDTITYAGESYDLTQLQEGAEIEIGDPFVGAVTRENAVIHCTLRYKYNLLTSENDQPSTWDAYTFDVTEGVCPCPIQRKPSLPSLIVQLEAIAKESHKLLLLGGYNETQIKAMTEEELIAALQGLGVDIQGIVDITNPEGLKA